MTTLLIVLLILMLFGAFPAWGYNQSWGYAPFGGLSGLLVLILVLFLLGVI